MNHSETLTKIAPALLKAQAEVGNAHNDSTNPHFKSKYASLASYIDAVVPVFNSHGLTITQAPAFEGEYACVDTLVLHTSGEWMQSRAMSPISKRDPQGVGSAITYLRRYSLAALACIAQEDDDGNAASKGTNDLRVLKSDITGAMTAMADKLTDEERERVTAAVQSNDTDRMRKALVWLRGQQM